ncbi:hypothetical protein IDG58_02695 [Pelagibacterales bacterium SAG-MED19]|nr:hypothetical protein [Pelagibacterales bacterium SAG-MED19]
MDEEITIINEKTRNEKIKSFFVENKKKLTFSIIFLVLLTLVFYSYKLYEDKQRQSISNGYNSAVIEYENGDKSKIVSKLEEVIKDKDTTYSPLALYYLIDNNLIENTDQVNEFFDILIDKTNLESEIKNLIIYKKALYNADFVSESELLNILNPIINSNSIWKSHALYLIAEYFYSKNEKKKSKEFFSQILSIENANRDIIRDTQKRLNRDLSE